MHEFISYISLENYVIDYVSVQVGDSRSYGPSSNHSS